MITVVLSFEKLCDEYWATLHHDHNPFYGLGEKHVATIQFLITLTEFAVIQIYSNHDCRDLERACIIEWASGTTNWATMRELDTMLTYVRKIPEDADVFASPNVIDWNDKVNVHVDRLIRKWQSTVLGEQSPKGVDSFVKGGEIDGH
jgi:hypothetical protein